MPPKNTTMQTQNSKNSSKTYANTARPSAVSSSSQNSKKLKNNTKTSTKNTKTRPSVSSSSKMETETKENKAYKPQMNKEKRSFTIVESNAYDSDGNMIKGGNFSIKPKQTPKDSSAKAANKIFKTAVNPPDTIKFTMREMIREKPKDSKGRTLQKPTYKYTASREKLENPVYVKVRSNNGEDSGYYVYYNMNVKRDRS